MKKLIITIAAFFIAISIAQSQSLKDISSDKFLLSIDKNDSKISFRIKPVYTSVQKTAYWEYFTKGFGATFTMQYDIGKMVSTFLDFNYSSIEYFNSNYHLTPPVFIHENRPSFMFVAGAKLYPIKSIIPAYIKGGLGIIARQNSGSFPPILNIGLGFEYKISEVINVFTESEADYFAGWLDADETTDISIGIGVSLYYEHFYKDTK